MFDSSSAQFYNSEVDSVSFQSNFLEGVTKVLYETLAESSGIMAAGIVAHYIFPSLEATFIGIGASFVLSRLAIKVLTLYNSDTLITVKKEVCKLKELYPKIQLISFIFSVIIGFIYSPLGFLCGVAVGSLNAVILDVENNNLLQKSKRMKLT